MTNDETYTDDTPANGEKNKKPILIRESFKQLLLSIVLLPYITMPLLVSMNQSMDV
jgi:hypothetical protein